MQLRSEHLTERRVAPASAAPAWAAPAGPQHAPSSDDDVPSGLLDYEAAARYLCTTTRHVRELWARRRLSAVKVARSVRFTKADLDAFIAANRVRALR